MAVRVALGAHDSHAAIAIDTQEAMRPAGRENGVNGNGEIPVGAVFKADRGR